MRFRLVPTDEGFYALFDEAAENVAETARRLRGMLTDFSGVEEKRDRVVECERRGDEITRELLRRLDSSFVTPFDREDIHALTEELDDVVDDIHAVADLLVLHHVERPLPQMLEAAGILLEPAETLTRLVRKLSALRGMEPELEAIDRLESQADTVYRRSVAELFSGEYRALDVLKWKDVFEALEHAVNRIESIGGIVESIAVKHA